jgi:hypothetical protein
MDALTVDQFRSALPDKVKKSVNQELIKKINKTLADPDMYETYRENLLGYVNVMQDGRFKISNYIDAVKYVSHKLSGKTNTDAFSKTFPDKMQRWAKQGVSGKDQASYITAYNKSKLVTLIMEQSLIPSWVLNQDLYQKALNVQAELMMTANSEKVRSDAANSLLTHLKMPETQKVELNVGVKKDSSIDALRQAVIDLASEQKKAIQAGAMNAQQIAHAPVVIEGERVDV